MAQNAMHALCVDTPWRSSHSSVCFCRVPGIKNAFSLLSTLIMGNYCSVRKLACKLYHRNVLESIILTLTMSHCSVLVSYKIEQYFVVPGHTQGCTSHTNWLGKLPPPATPSCEVALCQRSDFAQFYCSVVYAVSYDHQQGLLLKVHHTRKWSQLLGILTA